MEPVSAHWSATRIDVVETVWGSGFHTPGGEDHIPMLIKPFGLDETMSVLDLGAGLGGTSRLMARATGAWVTGLEADPVLAAAGQKRSMAAGLEKRAEIALYNPEAPAFDKRYDAIFSKEAFFTVRRKQELFEAIRSGLKPRGQFLFTDYVLKHSASTGDLIGRWREREEREPHLWTIGQMTQQLQTQGFDIRIAEDITHVHRAEIVRAWEQLPHTIAGRERPNEETQRLLLSEGDIWQRRVEAIDSGDLRVYRFFSLAPGAAD